MKVKRMGITETLRRNWLFSANKIKSSEYFSKQPIQLTVKVNSSLRHIIVTHAIVKLNKGKLDRKLKWNQQQDLYICVIVKNAQALCT